METTQVNQIKAVVNENGTAIQLSKKNPNFGYIMFRQESKSINPSTGWISSTKKSFLIKGEVAQLTAVMRETEGVLQGNLIIREVPADNVPADLRALFDKNKSFEENVARFAKRVAKDSPTLKQGNVTILRFTLWDATGEKVDSTLSHDNIDEISAWRESNTKTTSTAKTGKGAKL